MSKTNEKELTAREKVEAEIERMNEKVKINLFSDAKRYKDDTYVSVGGDTYQVKRGVPVEVPRKVAAIIREQEEQDRKTNERIERLVDKFNDEQKMF